MRYDTSTKDPFALSKYFDDVVSKVKEQYKITDSESPASTKQPWSHKFEIGDITFQPTLNNLSIWHNDDGHCVPNKTRDWELPMCAKQGAAYDWNTKVLDFFEQNKCNDIDSDSFDASLM